MYAGSVIKILAKGCWYRYFIHDILPNVEGLARSLSMFMTAADPVDEFIHMCVYLKFSNIYHTILMYTQKIVY